MRKKAREQTEARRLRAEGVSIRVIANRLGVALSSVSVWVRDVPLPARPAPSPAPSPSNHPPGSKTCGRCKCTLDLTAFSRHPSAGRQWWCRDCFRAYFRVRGELHRRQNRTAHEIRRIKARDWVAAYLEANPCVDCGETERAVLEFDHIAEKDAAVSVLVGAGWSIRRLEREVTRCEVVCVNCHRRRTAERDRSWRTDPELIDRNPRLTRGERRNLAYVRDLLLGSACLDCGEKDIRVLDFDHVGAKAANVVELARSGCSHSRLEAEVSQCEIRCARCHRLRTHGLNERRSGAA